jgi:hypothetical protein
MLALAIGVNGTVFAIADAMLFRGYPLVVPDERLVYLQERDPSEFQESPADRPGASPKHGGVVLASDTAALGRRGDDAHDERHHPFPIERSRSRSLR